MPAGAARGIAVLREPAASASDAPVAVHRGSDVRGQADALHARAFTTGGEIFLPHDAGPVRAGEGRALFAHEMTHVRQQRTLGDALPRPRSMAGRHLEAEATEAEAWARSDELALAQRSASRRDGDPAEPSPLAHAIGSSVVQTASTVEPGSHAAGTLGSRPPIMVQAADAAAPTAAPPAAPTADAGSGGAPIAASPVAAMGERDVEELLRKLFPKLRHHFARELLVARERAGSLADAR